MSAQEENKKTAEELLIGLTQAVAVLSDSVAKLEAAQNKDVEVNKEIWKLDKENGLYVSTKGIKYSATKSKEVLIELGVDPEVITDWKPSKISKEAKGAQNG